MKLINLNAYHMTTYLYLLLKNVFTYIIKIFKYRTNILILVINNYFYELIDYLINPLLYIDIFFNNK